MIASESLRTNPIDPLAAVSLGSWTRGRRSGGRGKEKALDRGR